jgi:hypothetical protein
MLAHYKKSMQVNKYPRSENKNMLLCPVIIPNPPYAPLPKENIACTPALKSSVFLTYLCCEKKRVQNDTIISNWPETKNKSNNQED